MPYRTDLELEAALYWRCGQSLRVNVASGMAFAEDLDEMDVLSEMTNSDRLRRTLQRRIRLAVTGQAAVA
jgi:hypothetical protein